MEYYNNILCITGSELILSEENPKGVMPKGTYDSLVQRKRITVVRRACYGTPALIDFYSIPLQYRQMWISKNGDPKKKGEENAFLSNYVLDGAAADFFKLHTFVYEDNEKPLSDDRQLEYTYNASVLNAIRRTMERNAVERRAKGIPRQTGFWKVAVSALPGFTGKGINHTLPENPRRLQDRYNDYVKGGYGILIHKNYQNDHSQKITPEAGEWVLAQWMSQIDRVNMEQLLVKYNVEADRQGWKKLKSSTTIRQYLDRPEIERIWHAARYGELSSKEKYSRQNRTLLPTRRDALWYSDGTKLNYFYRDELGNVHTCQVYEVMDVYSECMLGYHISASENYEAQYAAYKMAIQKSGHKPYEIKYDNQGGHKKLENGDFLANLAKHAIKTAPYNGKSKTIESAFGRFQAEFLHKDWFFTGQNIDTKKKESKANMEFILANTHKLKTLDEIKEVYRMRRDEWNAALHPKSGVARSEMYRTSVNEATHKVDVADMINMFGVTTKEPITYRANGIELEIKKQVHAYEVLTADGQPDKDFNRRNIGRKFYRRYCPDDLSVIGLYEKDATGMRFIALAQPYITVHRALQDQVADDFIHIRQTQVLNKEERIADEVQRAEILKKHGLHPNQHGLEMPPLKGITSGKKQKKDIGQMLKDVSNTTDMDAEKARRKAARDVAKAEQAETERREENRRDFLRRKRELELLSMN